jgi:hypothetical protein
MPIIVLQRVEEQLPPLIEVMMSAVCQCLEDEGETEDQEPTTISVIKTEPNVSCMPVVSVTHISYRLNPELPSPISVCTCETKI